MAIIARVLAWLIGLLAPLTPYILNWVADRIKKKEQAAKDEQAIKDKDKAIGEELKNANTPEEREKSASDTAGNL